MLACENLWFSYQDAPTLKGLTLDFSRQPVTGLVARTAVGNRRCL